MKLSTITATIAWRFLLVIALLASPLISNAESNSALDATSEMPSSNIHDDWQALLSMHIKTIDNGKSTEVDYAAIQQQQAQLKNYLNALSQITRREFDGWSKERQLAFLINAYNAWTVAFILTEYPDLESIKDLGSFFNSPWDKDFIPLLGNKISLNDIEHGLIRGSDRYNDPRIHFAVNCASIGCPALRNEAYTADKLEQQLTEQTQRFLTDTSRNYIKGETVYLSSIFKWYSEDFEMGFHGSQSISEFLILYSDALTITEAQKSALKKQKMRIKFLDYNWDLNGITQ